jgi:hypothetical protein
MLVIETLVIAALVLGVLFWGPLGVM